MADIQQLEDQIVSLTLLEASELVKKLEERLGVSAAAASRCGGSCGRRCSSGSGGRREDRVHRHPQGCRREQDQHHQGCARSHRPWLEGSQGPGRRRSQALEGEHFEGRRGSHRQEVRRRRDCRNQVRALRRATYRFQGLQPKRLWAESSAVTGRHRQGFGSGGAVLARHLHSCMCLLYPYRWARTAAV